MALLTKVLGGVHLIDTYANAALLTDQRLVLIDTSSDAAAQKILDAMKQLKVRPSDLTSIVITHTHPDHVSGLATLKRHATAAKVAAHEIEAPFIAKERVYDGPPGPSTQRHVGVPVDVRLKEGQVHEGLTVFHTPGHTRGSISLLDPERRLLIAGDALRTEGGVQPMEDLYNVDPAQHRASIKRLAAFDFDALVCGHGPPITSGAAEKVRTLARSLR